MSEMKKSFEDWLERHPEYDPVPYELNTTVVEKQVEAFRKFCGERFEEKINEINEIISTLRRVKDSRDDLG